jgi:hypothetical protein
VRRAWYACTGEHRSSTRVTRQITRALTRKSTRNGLSNASPEKTPIVSANKDCDDEATVALSTAKECGLQVV